MNSVRQPRRWIGLRSASVIDVLLFLRLWHFCGLAAFPCCNSVMFLRGRMYGN